MPTVSCSHPLHKDGASVLPREVLFCRKFYSLHKIQATQKQAKVVRASGEVLDGHALLDPIVPSTDSLPPKKPFFSIFQMYFRDAFQHPPARACAAISPHPNRTLIVAQRSCPCFPAD